jgi:glycosyltransferase involved in cell wall biosynthesis
LGDDKLHESLRIAVIIPALNEVQSLPHVLRSIDRTLVDRIVVGDNGSSDGTAEAARREGATVVVEARRGYGSACQRAVAAAHDADVLVFLDADGSEDPAEVSRLVDPIAKGVADLVIGSRVSRAEPGALTPVQRFGNTLACALIRWFWGVPFTDLGPFRAIRRSVYEELHMQDPDFGWTVEMQVKAAQRRLRTLEIPVAYRRRRLGVSKVSGTLGGSVRAGHRILTYVLAAKAADLRRARAR